MQKMVQIILSNKLAYTFILFGIMALIAVGVNAYESGGPASFVGHSADELNLTGGVSGKAIFNDRVGIGTLNPSTELHVVGGIRITGLIGCDTLDTLADGTLQCGTDETGSGGIDGSGTATYIAKFQDAETIENSNIYEDGSGNIGINNNIPTSTLDVDGTFEVTGDSDLQSINVDGIATFTSGVNLPTSSISGAGHNSGLNADMVDLMHWSTGDPITGIKDYIDQFLGGGYMCTPETSCECQGLTQTREIMEGGDCYNLDSGDVECNEIGYTCIAVTGGYMCNEDACNEIATCCSDNSCTMRYVQEGGDCYNLDSGDTECNEVGMNCVSVTGGFHCNEDACGQDVLCSDDSCTMRYVQEGGNCYNMDSGDAECNELGAGWTCTGVTGDFQCNEDACEETVTCCPSSHNCCTERYVQQGDCYGLDTGDAECNELGAGWTCTGVTGGKTCNEEACTETATCCPAGGGPSSTTFCTSMELHHNAGPDPCPSGWDEANYGGFEEDMVAPHYIRTCYRCDMECAVMELHDDQSPDGCPADWDEANYGWFEETAGCCPHYIRTCYRCW